MIKKLARDGQTMRAHRLVEEMRNAKNAHERPTYHMYYSPSPLSPRYLSVHPSLSFLSAYCFLHFSLLLSRYNSLILLYTKSGQLKKVLDVFQMMKSDGLQPNSRTYSILKRIKKMKEKKKEKWSI